MKLNFGKVLGLAVATAIAVAGMTASAKAGIITYNPAVPTGIFESGTPRSDLTVGSLITIGASNVTIDALGVQDDQNIGGHLNAGNGVAFVSTQVGIWNSVGTLLASATVTSADTLNADTYRYATIANLTLTAGAQYYIGATAGETFLDTGSPSDGANGTAFTATGGSGITLTDSVFTGGGFNFPNNSGGISSGRWGLANAEVASSTPEPASLGLLGVGAMGLLFRRKARKVA